MVASFKPNQRIIYLIKGTILDVANPWNNQGGRKGIRIEFSTRPTVLKTADLGSTLPKVLKTALALDPCRRFGRAHSIA